MVYYPIFYSKFEIEDSGFWRSFSFGMVSMIQSDFTKYGGFNLSRSGWGEEDVDLANKLIPNMQIIRTKDPDLIHPFHAKKCSKAMQDEHNFINCQKSKMSHKASSYMLYKLYSKKYFGA